MYKQLTEKHLTAINNLIWHIKRRQKKFTNCILDTPEEEKGGKPKISLILGLEEVFSIDNDDGEPKNYKTR